MAAQHFLASGLCVLRPSVDKCSQQEEGNRHSARWMAHSVGSVCFCLQSPYIMPSVPSSEFRVRSKMGGANTAGLDRVCFCFWRHCPCLCCSWWGWQVGTSRPKSLLHSHGQEGNGHCHYEISYLGTGCHHGLRTAGPSQLSSGCHPLNRALN